MALASLLDVGHIPSKPQIDPEEDDDRVVARWMDIGSYVGVLCKACVIQAGQVGWMRFGELLFFLPMQFPRSLTWSHVSIHFAPNPNQASSYLYGYEHSRKDEFDEPAFTDDTSF